MHKKVNIQKQLLLLLHGRLGYSLPSMGSLFLCQCVQHRLYLIVLYATESMYPVVLMAIFFYELDGKLLNSLKVFQVN